MRAARFHEFGDSSVMSLDILPDPVPRMGEVLIRVSACGVNRVDILSRTGQTPAPIELPHILGSEVAGEVHSVGDGVPGIEKGARVLVNPALSCGACDACLSGRDNMCRSSLIYGVQTSGGYCEYATAPASAIIALPESVSFEAAASVTVTGPTAWHMLFTRGGLRIGETVLVIAAGSGIGVMAVQLAKRAGARVIATASSDEKLEAARKLGADEVVNHSQPNWHREVRRLTNGEGADLVFEHVGSATWNSSIASMRVGGRLVTSGGHSGFDVAINLWSLFAKELTLVGSFSGTRQDLIHVLDLVAQGAIHPVIYATFPLERVAEAHVAMESRQVFGKILVVP